MANEGKGDGTPGHLRIQSVVVPVTSLKQSVEFFQRLDFRVLHRMVRPDGARFVAVAPRDGLTALLLVENDQHQRIGTSSGVGFVTDDIEATYRAWVVHGVRFAIEPRAFAPGIRATTFFDPDGNSFTLAELDVVTRQLEAERQQEAERVEAERRAQYELSLAAQIQAGLVPRHRPKMSTLDCRGICMQARRVGGDYFDFLKPRENLLAVVVGDVSGKGIGAALLLAGLQATLRNQVASHLDDLCAALSSVNEVFLGNSPANCYVTLFAGLYDDMSRRLRFVNCGHPPGIVMRQNGRVEMLDATAGVLGMFGEWRAEVSELQLNPGDLLALYSDGLTESLGNEDAEFGTSRLVEVLRSSRAENIDVIERAVIAAISECGLGNTGDDSTLVLARCLEQRC